MAEILATSVGLVLVLTTVPIFASIQRVPFVAATPMIVVSCATGAYAIQNGLIGSIIRSTSRCGR